MADRTRTPRDPWFNPSPWWLIADIAACFVGGALGVAIALVIS